MTVMFGNKVFNSEVFAKYLNRLPSERKDELIKSKVLVLNAVLDDLFKGDQTGTYYSTIPFHGRIGGEAVNYDGETDILANETDTYKQGVVSFGRANAWVEKDFSDDIAATNFMDNVIAQVKEYWDGQITDTIMAIIKGIFNMTGKKHEDFVTKHTYDASVIGDGKMSATTLNSAIQRASGDKKAKFTLVFMHSVVATNLENLKLLQFLTQTDALGIERPLPLAHWNGRLVIVDDGMPVEEVPATESVGVEGEDGYVPAQAAYTKYTTFIFGEGMLRFADLKPKVPHEVSRDPSKNGGQTTLYSRMRMAVSPYGISFTNKKVASFSPTNAEFEDGANWELINNGLTGDKFATIDHREIAIARIYSRG